MIHACSISLKRVCYTECDICNGSGDAQTLSEAGSPNAFMRPSAHSTSTGAWQMRQGRFKSIMAVLMPCRSDRSEQGLAPFSHLADGRMQLILVGACSRLHYLRFLASIPVTGAFSSSPPSAFHAHGNDACLAVW